MNNAAWFSVCFMLPLHVTSENFKFFANSELSSAQEMRKAGEEQYQLLRDRGKLPKYGECWKAALEHVEESCQQLTEKTQSDVALHITNCFLEMSGHKSYSCESDRKQNLRAICLQSMTDRAFNVYTEFFTHAQNICWFLQGQVWQETVEENILKVGRQLERSAKNQDMLLMKQRELLTLQEKMLKYSEEMDVMVTRFVESTRQHQDLIEMLTTSVSNLQSWLIGEVSWLDTAIFYLVASFIIVFATSMPRALAARLPMLALLGSNVFFERLLSYSITRGSLLRAGVVHQNYQYYVSYLRYTFVGLMLATLLFCVVMYKDYLVENNAILVDIKESIRDLKFSLCTEVKVYDQGDNTSIREIGSATPLQTGRFPSHLQFNGSTCAKSKALNVSSDSRESSRSNGRYNLRTRPEAVTLKSFD